MEANQGFCFKTLWLLWVSIVPRELSLQKILLLLTMIENKTSWNPLVNKTWQHIILTFCWRTSCYSTVVIRVFDLKISTNYVQNIKMSAFCPHSFAQTKTKGTELPDTFSPGGKSLSRRFGSSVYTVSRFTFSRSRVCLMSGRQQFGLSGIRMCRFEIRVVYAFPFPSVLIEAFLPVWHANNGKQSAVSI